MNRKTGILAGILLIFCIAAGILVHVYKPETATGEKEIDIVVIHANKTENTFTCQTNAEYLADAMTAFYGTELSGSAEAGYAIG